MATYLIPTGSVNVIGEIPTGIPVPHLSDIARFDWSMILDVVPLALTLAALASIDSLLTSLIADNITKTNHDSNKELIGQGLGNMVSGFFGGLPGAGATMRTVINIKTGGTTKLSIGVAAVVLIFSVVAIGPLISVIPKPVLSGILLTVGIGIIDKKGLRELKIIPRGDALVLLTVLFLTVFWDLINAVAIGVIISFASFVKSTIEISRDNSELKVWGDVKDEQYWAEELKVPKELEDRFVVKHMAGPLFFGLTSKFKAMTNEIPDVDFVIFRMDKVTYMDQSGLVAMEDTLRTLKTKGIDFLFVGTKTQPETMMRQVNIIPEFVTEVHLHESFKSCMENLVAELQEKPVLTI
jgi:SulP family sulfate permease